MSRLVQHAVTFTIAAKVDDLFLADCLVVAAEGGVNYWGEVVEYHHHALNDRAPADVYMIITEHEPSPRDTTGGTHLVTIRTMADGIRRLVERQVRMNDTLLDYLTQGVRENDAAYIDADLADCIVQAGVFGELVYG